MLAIAPEQLLFQCQAEVAETAVPYYAERYRAAEVFYWAYIPFWLHRDLAGRPGARILDIGCAYGTLAVYAGALCGGEVYCVDFTDRYLSPQLMARRGIRFQVSNIERDPFPWDLRFDAILLTEVLEHFNFHPVGTLRKIRSLLAPDGRLYLSTPDAAEWGRAPYYPSYREMPPPSPDAPVVDDHVYVYDRAELLAVVAEAGLRVLDLRQAPGCGYGHFNLVLAAA